MAALSVWQDKTKQTPDLYVVCPGKKFRLGGKVYLPGTLLEITFAEVIYPKMQINAVRRMRWPRLVCKVCGKVFTVWDKPDVNPKDAKCTYCGNFGADYLSNVFAPIGKDGKPDAAAFARQKKFKEGLGKLEHPDTNTVAVPGPGP